jgi:RNA polymerase-binding transcription factor DksA
MPVVESPLDPRRFERKLRDRLAALREDIRAALLRADAETYGELAGQVHDVEEEALADLLTDVNLAALSRDVQEVREIDAALGRIAARSYGLCSDCGEPIGADRLEANPAARRCLACQRASEARLPAKPPPKL